MARAAEMPSLGAPDDDQETLVGIAFDDSFRAHEFLTAVHRLAAHRRLKLKDAVTVIAKDDGRFEVIETIDPQPKKSAMTGAIWTGLVGLLLAGPVGWLAGAAAGAGVGALRARLIDLGIPDEWVSWFRQAAVPGTATVALLVTDIDRNALVLEVERFNGGRLVYANLDDYTLGRIRAALGQLDERAAPGTGPA